MPPESLELRKLELEIEKLELEVEDGRARLDHDREEWQRTSRGGTVLRERWLPPLVSVLAVVGALATAVFSIRNYLDQQARQYDFNLTHEAIELAGVLSTDLTQKQNASVYLLTAFERHAVPLLLMSLEQPTLRDPGALIKALGEIKIKPNVSPKHDVVEPLLDLAEARYRELLPHDSNSLFVLTNITRAIGALACEDRDRAVPLLEAFEKRIKAKPASSNPNPDFYEPLMKGISAARESLHATSC